MSVVDYFAKSSYIDVANIANALSVEPNDLYRKPKKVKEKEEV